MFWEHQKSKKWPHMVSNDKTTIFQELMFNTPKCSVEISVAGGPLTMTLLRRKVIWNHKTWKKRQKMPKIAYLHRIYDPLCLMSANTFTAQNSSIRCYLIFLKAHSIYRLVRYIWRLHAFTWCIFGRQFSKHHKWKSHFSQIFENLIKQKFLRVT